MSSIVIFVTSSQFLHMGLSQGTIVFDTSRLDVFSFATGLHLARRAKILNKAVPMHMILIILDLKIFIME